jgi:hypothetical protein
MALLNLLPPDVLYWRLPLNSAPAPLKGFMAPKGEFNFFEGAVCIRTYEGYSKHFDRYRMEIFFQIHDNQERQAYDYHLKGPESFTDKRYVLSRALEFLLKQREREGSVSGLDRALGRVLEGLDEQRIRIERSL